MEWEAFVLGYCSTLFLYKIMIMKGPVTAINGWQNYHNVINLLASLERSFTIQPTYHFFRAAQLL